MSTPWKPSNAKSSPTLPFYRSPGLDKDDPVLEPISGTTPS